jgi:hypothetical protein
MLYTKLFEIDRTQKHGDDTVVKNPEMSEPAMAK